MFCLCILLFVFLNSLRMITYIKVSIENLAGVCTNCLLILMCDFVCLLRSYQYFDQSYENLLQEGGRVRAAKSVYSAPLSQIGSSTNLHKGDYP